VNPATDAKFTKGGSGTIYDSGYIRLEKPNGTIEWFKGPPGLPFADGVAPVPCDPPTEDQLYPNGRPPTIKCHVTDVIDDRPGWGPGIIVERTDP